MRNRQLIFVVSAVALFGAVALVASAAERATPSTACETDGLATARVYGRDARLIAAFDASAPQIVAWQETLDESGGRMVSPYRGHASTERVLVCYYDGTFTGIAKAPGPAGPGLPQQAAPIFERIILLIDKSGEPQLRAAGLRGGLPLRDPRQ